MDELLEVADVAADIGLDGVLAWLLRLIGLVLLLAGVALWLFTDAGLLLPGALVVGGAVLLIVPGVVLALLELAG